MCSDLPVKSKKRIEEEKCGTEDIITLTLDVLSILCVCVPLFLSLSRVCGCVGVVLSLVFICSGSRSVQLQDGYMCRVKKKFSVNTDITSPPFLSVRAIV